MKKITVPIKRKRGMGFYRMTQEGKTIKEFTVPQLKKIIRDKFPNKTFPRYLPSKANILKSVLWEFCINNHLV